MSASAVVLEDGVGDDGVVAVVGAAMMKRSRIRWVRRKANMGFFCVKIEGWLQGGYRVIALGQS